jgi:tetratricopeptide (TPR) repeat protein
MTTTEEKIYQEALAAIEEQDNLRAKDLLTRLLKIDQNNPQYWLWMSAVVSSEKERRFCLQQVIKFDPNNSDARRGLILLGDLPLDEELRTPLANQQRKWSLPEIQGLEVENAKVPWVKIGLFATALLIVAALLILAFTSNRLWIFKNRQVAAIGTAQPTPTFPATNTPTITATQKFEGPTPPWMGIEQTYTPTPLYVNTPHPIIEAYRIAIRNYERNDWKEAITYFQQAIETDQNSADLPYLLGEAYRMNGQNNLALEAYDLSLAADGEFAPAHLGRARIFISQEPENYDQVFEELEKAIELDPYLAEAYIELANLQLAGNDLTSAQANLDKASLYLPDSPLVALANGEIALQMQDYDIALSYAQKANEADLTLLESYRFLGQAYQAAGRIEESLAPLLVFTIYSSNKDPLALAWLADAYAANGNMDQAIALYDEAISENKFAVEVYLKRGQMHLGLKDYESAFSDFDMAYKIRPSSYEACMLLGETLLKMEEPGDAYQQLSECQKLAQEDTQLARMFFFRALSLEALKNEVAVQDWERLLALPEAAIDPQYLATAQFYLGKYYTPTPSQTISKTLNVTPTPSASVSKTNTKTPLASMSPTPTAKN